MTKLWNRCANIAIFTSSLALTAGTTLAAGNIVEGTNGKMKHQKADNIIMMIPDGCDETVQTVARWYKGGDLMLDHMQTGSVKTHMANSVITGSAAAATAFATGHKTTARFLGVGPRTKDLITGLEPTAEPYAPVASVLEAAQRDGKAIGIVATSRITHATPAAFTSHIHDRGWDNKIMEHIVYNNVDVVFGGGARHLIPKDESYTTSFGATWKGKRADGENLIGVLKERGYQFVDSRGQMAQISGGKVWGLFDDSHMQPDIDRKYFAEHEPSLAEMVEKAIEILSQDPDGFVLMVEGSQVDWAGHNNDPIYMVTDFLAFDQAVQVATEYAEKDQKTVVMAFPDHNTGGMKIGHYITPMGYTETTLENLLDPLKGMKMSANGILAKMADKTDAALKVSVLENWNMQLTDDDVTQIRALEKNVGLSYALARVVSRNYTVIGWTTHGHTGETVPLWMMGQSAPVGVIDNTDLAFIAADAIGVDLDVTTSSLYVDLATVTQDFEIDITTDAENPVVKVAGAILPVSKDYLVKDGSTIKLPGLTVYAPETGKVYLSENALRELGLR